MSTEAANRFPAVSSQKSAISVAVLVGLTAICLAWPLWRAMFPLEISVDEPWNAYNADAVLQGRALYPDAQSLLTNNYPPLSFYLVAALSRISFDAIVVGRILSFAALGVTAVAIGALVRVLGGSRLGAFVGGTWFVATSARFFDEYVGKNDPHLPAIAIMVAALAWLMRRMSAQRAVEPAILLMVVAGFYKHTLLATPAAALIWLLGKDLRLGLRATLTGVAAAAAGLALCYAAYGEAFFQQLLFVREYWFMRAVDSLGHLQWIAPALVVCGIWWWYDRDSEAARFTRLYVAMAFAIYFLQKMGQGVGLNAQFELLVATALATGMALSRIEVFPGARRRGIDNSRCIVVGVLVARLLLSTRLETYLIFTSPDYRAQFQANTAVMAAEVERVRAMPGPVHCTFLTVCRQAGKPWLLDDFALVEKHMTGRITVDELKSIRDILGVVAIDERASAKILQRRYN